MKPSGLGVPKSQKTKFVFYNTNGTLTSTKHNVKDFPEQWLTPKGAPSKKSAKSAVKYLLVFTTPELSLKQSKQLSNADWTALTIGTQFWLKTGERAEVVADAAVNHQQWKTIFGAENSYKKCGKLFLDLSDSQQKEFAEIPVDDQIAYLKVPVRAQKNFKDARWGLESLKKYCDTVAYQDERRKQEQERKWREEREREEQESAQLERVRLALRDDTLGELDGIDSVLVETSAKVDAAHLVNADFDLFDRYRVQWEDNMDRLLGTDEAGWIPTPAHEKLQKKYCYADDVY